MNPQFTRHYTREEARAELPLIRKQLAELQRLRRELAQVEQRLESIMSAGTDAGGPSVNSHARSTARIHEILREFARREIFIKDADRGLVDFPAIIGGREVFLCWELDEDDIEFWHDIDAGYAGRERLAP
jgi:hypothetical protein